MKALKYLGLALKVAAPVVAGAVAGPGVGVMVAASLGVGAAVKKGGKEIESFTGARPHKVAAPAAAVVIPALLASWLSPETLGTICEFVARACDRPETLAIIPGLIAWLANEAGSGVAKVAGK